MSILNISKANETYNIIMDVLSRIYASLIKDKRKERFETILEPLQAITQLALLSFCPKGSKLSITNNILFIQTPTWSQGFMRSYNQDQRDDLFFLFSVIKRFNKFYSSPVNKTHHSSSGAHKTGAHNNDSAAELFSMLIELSKSGIDNLIQTYSESDQTTLLHTLRMYRTMLDKPDAFVESAGGASAIDVERDSIDDIFIKITELYSPTYIELLHNIFKLAKSNPEHYEIYLTGINTLMAPINSQLNKWISDHIVF